MTKNKSILLTGATGFVGDRVIKQISSLPEYQIIAPVRSKYQAPDSIKQAIVSGIEATTDWSSLFDGVNLVIHCAARVHVMNVLTGDPLADFREVNRFGTLNLAQQAAEAGVKRFIFISSIKVNGETTTDKSVFKPSDKRCPEDPYGISKSEAEIGLQKIAKDTGMEVVIIRPPLVYGPGVKANFLNLLKLSATKLPLPFGSINNKRSMVYIDNLVDLIVTCIDHPHAGNKVFLASDGDDLSLSRLLRLMRKSMNKPAWLISVPALMFELLGKLIGKSAVVDRLIGDLQVDSSDTQTHLDWTPPYSVEQGIQATVDDFLLAHKENSNK
jgi:UDP-glucose 4-epimerase